MEIGIGGVGNKEPRVEIAEAFRTHRSLSRGPSMPPGHEHGNGLYVESFMLLRECDRNSKVMSRVITNIWDVDTFFRHEEGKPSPYFPPNTKLAHLFALTSLMHFKRRDYFKSHVFLGCARQILEKEGVCAESGGGLEAYRALASEICAERKTFPRLLYRKNSRDWDKRVANEPDFRQADELSRELVRTDEIPTVGDIEEEAERSKCTMRRPRTKVFICYSHKDKELLDSLWGSLHPVSGKVEVWHDGTIKAGTIWRKEIENALAAAKVAVFLLSIDFLRSRFITEVEMPALLAAAKRDEAKIIWFLVRPCLWEKSPFADYQAAYDTNISLMSLPKTQREAAIVNIAKQIIEEL